jgi:subtilisin family serine protease
MIIEQAIKWAVAAEADIISMSASLDKDSEALRIAVNDAIAARVVVISSTHGKGQNTADAGYPAQYKDVFAIASADSSGAPSSGTNMEHADYLFQGEKIVAKTELPGLEADGSSTIVDGPSVATAIAAGVASLILSCDRFVLHRAGTDKVWENRSKLKRDIVERIFNQTKDGKYVRPWIFFAEDKARRSWGEGDSVLKWMSQRLPLVLD